MIFFSPLGPRLRPKCLPILSALAKRGATIIDQSGSTILQPFFPQPTQHMVTAVATSNLRFGVADLFQTKDKSQKNRKIFERGFDLIFSFFPLPSGIPVSSFLFLLWFVKRKGNFKCKEGRKKCWFFLPIWMARPKMSVLFMPSEDMCRATAAYSSFPLLFTCQVHREKNAGIEANRNFLSLVATINEITYRHTHTDGQTPTSF